MDCCCGVWVYDKVVQPAMMTVMSLRLFSKQLMSSYPHNYPTTRTGMTVWGLGLVSLDGQGGGGCRPRFKELDRTTANRGKWMCIKKILIQFWNSLPEGIQHDGNPTRMLDTTYNQILFLQPPRDLPCKITSCQVGRSGAQN